MNERRIKLGIEDQETLKGVLKKLSTRSGFQQSLNRFLQRWNTLVAEVARGYDGSLYEYTNALSARDLISEIESELSDSGKRAIHCVVAPLDELFFKSTIPTECLSKTSVDRDMFPWWYRIPRNPGTELREDLESENLI